MEEVGGGTGTGFFWHDCSGSKASPILTLRPTSSVQLADFCKLAIVEVVLVVGGLTAALP